MPYEDNYRTRKRLEAPARDEGGEAVLGITKRAIRPHFGSNSQCGFEKG
jgi:hypothetical protein